MIADERPVGVADAEQLVAGGAVAIDVPAKAAGHGALVRLGEHVDEVGVLRIQQRTS